MPAAEASRYASAIAADTQRPRAAYVPTQTNARLVIKLEERTRTAFRTLSSSESVGNAPRSARLSNRRGTRSGVTSVCREASGRRSLPASDGIELVRVRRDPVSELLVGPLHLRMVTVYVLTRLPEQLFVVGTFQPVPARTVDRLHESSSSGFVKTLGRIEPCSKIRVRMPVFQFRHTTCQGSPKISRSTPLSSRRARSPSPT